MSSHPGTLLILTIACAMLSACGKGDSSGGLPKLSAQDAYKHCTSNSALSMQLSSPDNGGKTDPAEAMGNAIKDCMQKYNYKCTQASPSEPCDWTSVK